MDRSTFVYVSYIRTTPEKLWAALTDPEFMRQYWFGAIARSEFTAGAPWALVSPDGQMLDDGRVLESVPPRRLVIHWQHRTRPELAAEGPTRCTLEIEPFDTAVKLTITHEIERSPSALIDAVAGGWPKIVSNLKSLLETGAVTFSVPYPGAAR